MTLKQKILSVFELVRGLIGKRAARTELADEFSAYEKYEVGRLVVYEDELYRCVTKHTGIWNKSDFEKATVDSALQLKGSGGITEIPDVINKSIAIDGNLVVEDSEYVVNPEYCKISPAEGISIKSAAGESYVEIPGADVFDASPKAEVNIDMYLSGNLEIAKDDCGINLTKKNFLKLDGDATTKIDSTGLTVDRSVLDRDGVFAERMAVFASGGSPADVYLCDIDGNTGIDLNIPSDRYLKIAVGSSALDLDEERLGTLVGVIDDYKTANAELEAMV